MMQKVLSILQLLPDRQWLMQTNDAVNATYLEHLFRYATSLNGDVSTFSELANAMNANANANANAYNVLLEHMKPMHFLQGQLKHWFKN